MDLRAVIDELQASIRKLEADGNEMRRKLANVVRFGTVMEPEGGAPEGTVRLKDEDGLESPDMKWMEASASADGITTHTPPRPGMRMMWVSQGGDLGVGVAVGGMPNDQNPPASKDGKVHARKNGDTVETFGKTDHAIETSGTALTSAKKQVKHKSAEVQHDAQRTRTTGKVHLATGGTTV